MSKISDIIKSVPGEASIERLIGDINVKRLDGTVLRDVQMYRKEVLLDVDDIESVYRREYVAYVGDGPIEEIFLGDDNGRTIILKENVL